MPKKFIKEYVKSGIIYGAGLTALGAMGAQGSNVAAGMGKGVGMLGAVGTAGIGMSIVDMANKFSKKGKPYRFKKGKHIGMGEW